MESKAFFFFVPQNGVLDKQNSCSVICSLGLFQIDLADMTDVLGRGW